jgi:hypothetical protein
MVLSWALTEVIRYAFYAATLLADGNAPALLTWARYSTFFVLYPTGAGSEALVNFATLPVSLAHNGAWFDARPLAQWGYVCARARCAFRCVVAWYVPRVTCFFHVLIAVQVCIRCIRI